MIDKLISVLGLSWSVMLLFILLVFNVVFFSGLILFLGLFSLLLLGIVIFVPYKQSKSKNCS